jgi:hypothetical protein
MNHKRQKISFNDLIVTCQHFYPFFLIFFYIVSVPGKARTLDMPPLRLSTYRVVCFLSTTLSWCLDTQHNDTQNNNSWHNDTKHYSAYIEKCDTQHNIRYTECHFTCVVISYLTMLHAKQFFK